MSRFYNTLKEASRSYEGTSSAPSSTGQQISAEDAPAASNVAETSEAPPSVSAPVISNPPEKGPSAHSNGASHILHTDSTPAMAVTPPASPKRREVAFDPKARLLLHSPDSIVVEHYRRLRTKILQQHDTRPFRTMVVTSPSPQEGKTVTAMNLGLSFAMLPDLKVLVVDGDLRRGSLGNWLGMSGQPGLSNLLDGSARLEDVLLTSDKTSLQFLVRGTSPIAPAELLHSMQMKDQFRQLAEQFDLVLVDSPPVNLVTDVQLLASACDAVLVIARAFTTSKSSLEKALQDLAPFRLLGAVLNGGTRAERYKRYGGYY